jgi:predicted XRE-type DNA-binding protein
MKKTEKQPTDLRVTEGSGNVFIDLGFEPAEAEVLQIRADVMLALERLIEKRGWTQEETAKKLGINQPRVSRLRNGAWKDFNLEALLTLAVRAGMRPVVKVN